MSEIAVQIEGLSFSYGSGRVPILTSLDLQITRGERVFIHGPSGSGKSTLLGLMTGILSPQSGRVKILGQDFSTLKPSQRDRLRGEDMGYIFQSFNLIPYLNVYDNIALPLHMSRHRVLRINGAIDPELQKLAQGLGISELLSQAVMELSVGQQQRVAAARALLGRPPILIADEPTSALDYDNREAFIQMLFQQAEQFQTTIVFVSHDHSLGHLFERKLALGELNQTSLA